MTLEFNVNCTRIMFNVNNGTRSDPTRIVTVHRLSPKIYLGAEIKSQGFSGRPRLALNCSVDSFRGGAFQDRLKSNLAKAIAIARHTSSRIELVRLCRPWCFKVT